MGLGSIQSKFFIFPYNKYILTLSNHIFFMIEWLKKKGWIKPAEFDFDELMKIITYMTRPATLGSINARIISLDAW